ncbi:MAG: PD40 domain-containing protein [Nitrospirae bacterium]|nr:PD40 domain-containing protein [Nitrospirota bacterium]
MSKEVFIRKRLKLKVFFIVFAFFILYSSFFSVSHAKVYLDITSPAQRKIPTSITHKGTSEAAAIEEIIKNDLYFTGIFSDVAPEIPGAEIRIEIEAQVSENMDVYVTVTDMIEGVNILQKIYSASTNIIRALAHNAANDIFKAVTGRNGIFRTQIAYISVSDGKKELYMMDWDGYNPRRIVSSRLALSHNWSYDGNYIAYSSEGNKKWTIYLIDLMGAEKETLFQSEGLNLAGNISSGSRFAFSSSKDGSPEIYVMDINKKIPEKLTKSYGIDVSPAFSPDASQIAFVSDRGGTPQIYIMNADGGGVRRITFEGSYNTSPAWSPDGSRLAYAGRVNGKNQIFVIKSDGTEMRQLTETGNNEEPAFSPDGLFMAFDSDRDGRRGIYVMRATGEEQRRITPKESTARAPRWSPFKK